MMEKQDTNPLLDQMETKLSSPESQDIEPFESLTQQPSTSALTRKIKKPKTRSGPIPKPKLPSVHEAEAEGPNRKSRKRKDEETSTCPDCLEAEQPSQEGHEKGKNLGRSYFGVRSYLHQFYENRTDTSGRGGVSSFL